MKKSLSPFHFVCGALFGVVLALCLGAVQNPKNPPPAQPSQPAASEPSGFGALKFFTYPSGGTGIFDPATGLLYIYDSDVTRCYLTRKLHKLGEPMERW